MSLRASVVPSEPNSLGKQVLGQRSQEDEKEEDMRMIKVVTANTSGWRSVKNTVHGSEADVVMIQEHRRTEDEK